MKTTLIALALLTPFTQASAAFDPLQAAAVSAAVRAGEQESSLECSAEKIQRLPLPDHFEGPAPGELVADYNILVGCYSRPVSFHATYFLHVFKIQRGRNFIYRASKPVRQPQPPAELVKCLSAREVEFFDAGGALKKGTIVLNNDLADEVAEIFAEIRQWNEQHPEESLFPLTSVIPVSDPRFQWSDSASMAADNSSAYNYRKIAGSHQLSLHALGRAIDLNPRCNPFVKFNKDGAPLVEPRGAVYDEAARCALSRKTNQGRFVIQAFVRRGWRWGGDWKNPRDYQHFEKPGDAGSRRFCRRPGQ